MPETRCSHACSATRATVLCGLLLAQASVPACAPVAHSPLWKPTEEGVRITYTYAGKGKLFLVGDFNRWSCPGHPLRPSGKNTYTAVLRLPPGAYEYKIRRLLDSQSTWLPLPPEAPVVEDGFGGANGRLVVKEPNAH